jgi:hypothetical protein
MRAFMCLTLLAVTPTLLPSSQAGGDKPKPAEWATEFPLEKDELVSAGRNEYFILEAGYVLVFDDGMDKLVYTVTGQTKKVGDIETRVIEGWQTKNGKLAEKNRGYFAISKKTKNVYYFGQDVDRYEDGKVKDHEGTWLSGVNGAKFGLMMPGTIVLKAKYHQEQAAGVAMDRAENISVTETVGMFKNCLKVEETTPLNAEYKAAKFYAPGIGLVQDGAWRLTRHGFVKQK